MPDMKRCNNCETDKPLNEFYLGRGMADGRLNVCKECRRSYQRERHAMLRGDPDYKAARARWHRKVKLRDAYGVTVAEYEAMLAAQGGCCAICGDRDPGRNSLFFPIDHDHVTGEVRGLLCHGCNLGIAQFAEDADQLLAAAAYLIARQDVLGRIGVVF